MHIRCEAMLVDYWDVRLYVSCRFQRQTFISARRNNIGNSVANSGLHHLQEKHYAPRIAYEVNHVHQDNI